MDRAPAHAGLKRLGIALALSATTFGAHAAGLGRLQLMSNLGQPLRAEIELTAIGREEAGSVTARLAPPAAFSQAGIEYGTALTSLRFSVQRRASGQAYVLVTSVAQVNEPFLDLLVELTWASGRLVREYTVLLDPPETRTALQSDPAAGIVQAATPAAPTAVRRAPRAAQPAAESSNAGSGSARRGTEVAASPSAAPGASSGDYVVKSGDTAMSIARSSKPDNVSLEQMLAALYRDNAQAFGGNINRLMAGATLHIPDAANAQGIDGGEARRIVAQSSNFGRYGQRIAAGASDATRRAAGPSASGRLSTQVQDQASAAESADRLQLSRPDASRSATGAVGKRTGAGASTADEVAAKDRELTEARTRLALLEKNVTDLQELLKLKNQTLADLQKGTAKAGDSATSAIPASVSPPTAAAPSAATPPAATSATPASATPSAPPAAAPTPAPPAATVLTSSAPPAPTPAPADATPPVAVAPAVAPAPVKKAPAAPLAPVTEDHWYDAILDNTLLMVGLVVLLLALLAAAVFAARRRKLAGFEDSIFVDNSVLHANSVFGTTGGQSVDTANSGFHSNFVPVAGNLPEHNEVDPVAEADVYIAYGRDAQAEEILKEALRADPSRHAVRLKLLEIYAKRGDAKTFETMASELYASTGGQGDEWRQAANLGASLDPRNPLYADAVPVDEPHAGSHATPAALAAIAAGSAAAAAHADDAGAAHLGTDFGAVASQSFGMSSLNFNTSTDLGSSTIAKAGDLTRTDPMPRTSPTAPTSAPDMDLDFDLGGQGAGVAPLQAASPPAAQPNGIDPHATDLSRPGDPFTASAFGSDATARTAVNLPAFRARNGQQAQEPAGPTPTNGFSASDIFGSTIVADTQPMPDDTPPLATPVREGSLLHASDFQTDDDHQFDKTEPLDAFSKISLDLDQTEFSGEHRTDLGVKTDVWQAMATKLDLALAYSDIGDKDGARELLEEVVRSGDPTQAERARQLIAELG